MPDTPPNTSTETARPRPVVLCILDGWGERAPGPDNAIEQAATPTWDHLRADCPFSHLQASALDVGLPEGQMGNSEVGHMNIGAGRVVMQDLPLIDKAISDGAIAQNDHLQELIKALKDSGGTCHLMGLMSPGGVHSHQKHFAVLAMLLSEAGVAVAVHAFLDGRDTPPSSAIDYLKQFQADTKGAANLSIATVSGRYYAMDRDKRWERVEKAYLALAEGKGETADTALAAVEQSYDAGTTDEFVLPTVVGKYAGMADGDGILMVNFRADRAREILATLVDPAFDGFSRSRQIAFAARAGMTEYSTELNAFLDALFPQRPLTHILGQVVADAGMTQLRIAETEKYAHVTFFFNGGEEQLFDGEERILVPSPKVATYDLQPEMSAPEVTDKLVTEIDAGKFDLIVVNYANGDMVGHTGIFDAAVKAAETVDTCLRRLEDAVTRAGGVMLITADHGNAEQMDDPETGQPHTAHTLSPVPFVMVNPPENVDGLQNGVLADIAPTILTLLGLPQPGEMTGRSLITPSAQTDRAARRHATA